MLIFVFSPLSTCIPIHTYIAYICICIYLMEYYCQVSNQPTNQRNERKKQPTVAILTSFINIIVDVVAVVVVIGNSNNSDSSHILKIKRRHKKRKCKMLLMYEYQYIQYILSTFILILSNCKCRRKKNALKHYCL